MTEFVSLDGVMEDPGGSEKTLNGGWAFQFNSDAANAFKFEELQASDAQLLGRVTYEGFASAWPTVEGTGAFGEKMNGMPKIVVSTTLQDPTWNNTTVVSGDLAAEVGKLKEQYAGDILVAGSATLVQSLLAADLVDQLNLMVFPIVLGGGKRLFADSSGAKPFELFETIDGGPVAILKLRRPAGPTRELLTETVAIRYS